MDPATYKWYVINTAVSCENKVAKLIVEEAAKKGLEELIGEVIVPVKMVPIIRRGKRVQSIQKILPGYVLVRTQPCEVVWNLIKNTQHVTRFLGDENIPSEIPDVEVQDILKKAHEVGCLPITDLYEVGDLLKLIDGPFEGLSAVIESVDNEKKKLKVSVSIFGRESPLEVTFEQVERIKQD